MNIEESTLKEIFSSNVVALDKNYRLALFRAIIMLWIQVGGINTEKYPVNRFGKHLNTIGKIKRATKITSIYHYITGLVSTKRTNAEIILVYIFSNWDKDGVKFPEYILGQEKIILDWIYEKEKTLYSIDKGSNTLSNTLQLAVQVCGWSIFNQSNSNEKILKVVTKKMLIDLEEFCFEIKPQNPKKRTIAGGDVRFVNQENLTNITFILRHIGTDVFLEFHN